MDMKEEYTQGYNVLLYNQGFGKFGPMEQCDTGEWVKWDDIEPFLRTAELRVQTAMETEKELSADIDYQKYLIDLQTRLSEDWREKYYSEREVSEDLRKHLDNWRAAAIAQATAFLACAIGYIIRGGV